MTETAKPCARCGRRHTNDVELATCLYQWQSGARDPAMNRIIKLEMLPTGRRLTLTCGHTFTDPHEEMTLPVVCPVCARAALRDPTPADLRDPLFEAIWQAIKRWDLEREPDAGRANATGTDVMTILTAVRAVQQSSGAEGVAAMTRGGHPCHGNTVVPVSACESHRVPIVAAGDRADDRAVPGEPPEFAVQFAISASLESPCRSKRGVAIWDSREVNLLITTGWNMKPKPFTCDGSAQCKATCRTEAIHAEQMALLHKLQSVSGCELLHVKTVDGQLVPSGGPSCAQCSKLILYARIAGVWLYHAEGWRRYDAAEFHRLSLIAEASALPEPQTVIPDDDGPDTTCDNDVGRTCRELWPQDRASWCDGCCAAEPQTVEPPPTETRKEKTIMGSCRDTEVPVSADGGVGRHSAPYDRESIWSCKIGAASNVPSGADFPMRHAVREAYRTLTGAEPEFIFSGWGATLDRVERAVVAESAKRVPHASASSGTGTASPQDSKASSSDHPSPVAPVTAEGLRKAAQAFLDFVLSRSAMCDDEACGCPTSQRFERFRAVIRHSADLIDTLQRQQQEAETLHQVAAERLERLFMNHCDLKDELTEAQTTIASLQAQVYVRQVLSDDTPMTWQAAHHATSAACATLRAELEQAQTTIATLTQECRDWTTQAEERNRTEIDLRASLATVTAERDTLKATRRIHELDNHHNAALCPYCTPVLTAQAEAARSALLDQVEGIVTFHPPPGPPDPPPSHATVTRCPSGHELRWVSNQVAICLGDCLTPAYVLERRYGQRVHLTSAICTCIGPLALTLRRVVNLLVALRVTPPAGDAS